MDYSNNNYKIQKRMMLDYYLYDNNKKVKYAHHTLLSIDGNNSNIYGNEVITIYKAESKTNIISFSENNFFEHIRQKMR